MKSCNKYMPTVDNRTYSDIEEFDVARIDALQRALRDSEKEKEDLRREVQMCHAMIEQLRSER